MELLRRRVLELGLAAAALSTAPRIAAAQVYPDRPVHWIVASAAGNTTDILARLMGERLSKRLGQPFIIENRPGAGSNIGTEAALRAPADGYTLLLIGAPQLINATLYRHLSFDFIRDIAPVASMVRVPNVMVVSPSFPARTVPEFITYAKEHPGSINFASPGVGTSLHVCGELFKMMTGVNMVHVPYRSASAALADLVSGQVQVMFENLPSAITYIRNGMLRPLGVTTTARSEVLPDVPTVAEFIPGFEATAVAGVGAPTKTPNWIIHKLNQEINAGLADPTIEAKLANMSVSILKGSPADYGRLLTAEIKKWKEVAEFSGARAE